MTFSLYLNTYVANMTYLSMYTYFLWSLEKIIKIQISILSLSKNDNKSYLSAYFQANFAAKIKQLR